MSVIIVLVMYSHTCFLLSNGYVKNKAKFFLRTFHIDFNVLCATPPLTDKPAFLTHLNKLHSKICDVISVSAADLLADVVLLLFS